MERTQSARSLTYLPRVGERIANLSELVDDILREPNEGELSELIAVCGRAGVQACIQIGCREAEEREKAKELARLVTVAEASSLTGASVWTINKLIQRHHIEPCGEAKRNRRYSLAKIKGAM